MENNDTIFSDIHPVEKEASLFQGFLLRAIDLGVDLLILLVIYRLILKNILEGMAIINPIVFIVIAFVVIIGYRFIFLAFFNKTIGMMVCGVKYLNKEFQPLSTKEKLLSLFRTRFSKIKYYKDK